MRLNRLKCLLALTLIVAVGTSHAEPLKTHDKYLHHYENGFYSGLGAEISTEADTEKSEQDDPFVNEESKDIPDRYAQLGLDSVGQVDNFLYRRSRRADIQSVIVRDRSGASYLLVFGRSIPYQGQIVGYVDRDLTSGSTKIRVGMRPNLTSGPFDRDESNYRVEAIYPLKDMEEEKRVIKFLRANN